MRTIKLLALLALFASVAWCIATPGYEPAIAIITSLSALIGTFLVERSKNRDVGQRQSVSEGAIGVQAGRDVVVGNVSTSKDQGKHVK